jgi:hypothetical protein
MENDDLPADIREILNGISGKVLKIVFIECDRRLKTCIDARGGHVESIIIYTVTYVQQPSRHVDATFRGNTLSVLTCCSNDIIDIPQNARGSIRSSVSLCRRPQVIVQITFLWVGPSYL